MRTPIEPRAREKPSLRSRGLGLRKTLIAGILLMLVGCGEPTVRELENRRELEALLTAISLKNKKELDKDIRRIEDRHTSGGLSDEGYKDLQEIIKKAMADDWAGPRNRPMNSARRSRTSNDLWRHLAMKKLISASALITVIVLSTAWAGWKLLGQRPRRPVAGSFHRSKVDSFGHTRGIVQVDLMRRMMAEQDRSTPPAPEPGAGHGHLVPSQDHPLLGRRAPAFTLKDARGMTWDLGEEVSKGPVVIVFYLGSTCMACVAHLVELDVAISRFDERGARVLAVSGDSPEFSTGTHPQIRRVSDPTPERSRPRHLLGLRCVEADPRRGRRRRRSTARYLRGGSRWFDPVGLPRESPLRRHRSDSDRTREGPAGQDLEQADKRSMRWTAAWTPFT